MPRTNWEALASFDLDPPTIDAQARIATYLDAETAQIDELIAEQQRLLCYASEHLETRRRLAVLGADGRGGSHWDYGRLKRFVRAERGRFTHRPRNDPALYDGPYPFIQTGDIARAKDGIVETWTQSLNERGLAASRLAPRGTLVMAIAANIGDVAELGFEACFPDSVVALTPRVGVTRPYLVELIRALRPELVNSSTLNTQLNINVDRIGDIPVPIPPPGTQLEVVESLRREQDLLRSLEAEVGEQITLLREHRQALITHAVTQGIDGLPGVA